MAKRAFWPTYIYIYIYQGCAADQEETGLFDSNLIIKSDHEVGLRHYWYWVPIPSKISSRIFL